MENPDPKELDYSRFNRWLGHFKGEVRGQLISWKTRDIDRSPSPSPVRVPSQPDTSVYGKPKFKTAVHGLLVEDDPALRRLYLNSLPHSMFYFDATGDGLEGMHLLLENKYQFLLMDIDHPSINGYDMLKALRNHKRFKKLPIIIASARCDRPEGELKARVLGATAVLAKPFELEDLIAALKKAVKARKQKPARRRKR